MLATQNNDAGEAAKENLPELTHGQARDVAGPARNPLVACFQTRKFKICPLVMNVFLLLDAAFILLDTCQHHQ